MNSLSPFQPYNQKLDDLVGIHCRVSRQDYELIQTVCPLHGVIQLICGTIIHEIAKQLKENGITTYNPEAFITHIRRLTNSSTARPESKSDEPSGLDSLRPTDSTTPSTGNNGIGTKQRVGIFDSQIPIKIKILGGTSEARGGKP